MNTEIWLLRSTHLGKIGFRLSLVSFCCALALTFSLIFSGVLFITVALFGIAFLILSFGTILVVIPDYLTKYNALLNSSGEISTFLLNLLKYVPIFSIISLITSVIGFVFLSLNKSEKHLGQSIFCIISFIVCLIILILNYTGFFASLIV